MVQTPHLLDDLISSHGVLPDGAAARLRLAEWLDAGEAVALMALAIGRLDAVNMAYGEATGDAALGEIAARLSACAARDLTGPWLAARIGGGQFLIIATRVPHREQWQLFAAQVVEAVTRPFITGDATLRLTARGMLALAKPADNAGAVLDRLGEAVGDMMASGGQRIEWVDGAGLANGLTLARMEADLLAALDADQIEVVYQPQYECRGEALVGAEALARWNHPMIGQLDAATLFAIAGRADHVVQLSQHIARRALADAREWPDHLRLSLNMTPAELAMPDADRQLIGQLAQSGFDPRRLTLEVTEELLLADVDHAARVLGTLADHGIRIALDDFGAGFCNFRYLKVLPLDYLKLDRSMIDGITHDPRDLAVLRGIVALGRALDLKIVAEGIENKDQLLIIAQEGCETYQGFLRSKPVRAQEFHHLTRLAGNPA